MSVWSVLALGLLLGIRHAFDTDHLVAVTTIVSEYRNPLRAIWIGVSWGLGHTTTLFLAGVVLLLLDVQMPERLALLFEFLVGIMLILLGTQAFLSLRRLEIHAHPHQHENGETDLHEHFHIHGAADEHSHRPLGRWEKLSKLLIAGITPGESQPAAESAGKALKPFFRLKSYLVGIVHGMAGSAALMLMVLASIESTVTGAMYILLFGLGTVVSMGLVSIFISLPFSVSGRLPRLNRAIQAITGTISILFGLWLMYQVGIIEGLLTGG
ncbi:MAG: sulfite exporter TauE/SafE family protein [Chloroflexi bacterium]|nr:sulfite exporter TauE/SafE family protein [Chloroflexota bacterium]